MKAWELWRQDNPDLTPDLSGADLSGSNIESELLYEPTTRFIFADFRRVNFKRSILTGVHLRGALLRAADLSWADLSSATFHAVWLGKVDFSHANLTGTSFIDCFFDQTLFLNTTLRNVKGLAFCSHFAP